MSNTSVFVFLTRSCNLACKHCYVSAEPKLKDHMSLDMFRQLLELLAATGIHDVRLTGGEPTIHPEFVSFLELLDQRKINPRLITNGIVLMKMRSPEIILDKLSRCWISVYGITAQQHDQVGGGNCSLENILDFAGQQSKLGYWVGVSVLLSEVDIHGLNSFVGSAQARGVRYLRFIFAEPSGRANVTGVTFDTQGDVGDRVKRVVDYLYTLGGNNAFEFLSVNNPFDLDTTTPSSQGSCILKGRRMWSISPTGDVYSCCFNVYEPDHFVTNILSSEAVKLMSRSEIANVYAARCKGLEPSFWSAELAPTCPISTLVLSSLH